MCVREREMDVRKRLGSASYVYEREGDCLEFKKITSYREREREREKERERESLRKWT